MASTGQYSGQYWRLDPWPTSDNGGYRLSNNFTGPDMHLDVYSGTLQPHLASGDFSGQHWTPNSLNGTTTATTAMPISSSTSTSMGTAATQDSGGHSLSAGQIAGIAIGGVVALVLIAGVIAFIIVMATRRRNRSAGRGDAGTQGYGVQGTGQSHAGDKSVPWGMTSPPPTYTYDTTTQPDLHNALGAELAAGGNKTLRVELPSPERTELPLSTTTLR